MALEAEKEKYQNMFYDKTAFSFEQMGMEAEGKIIKTPEHQAQSGQVTI